MKADGLQAIMSSNMSLTRFVPKMSAGLSKSLLSKSAYPPALVVAGMSESDYCEGSTSCHMASLALAALCIAVLRHSWLKATIITTRQSIIC